MKKVILNMMIVGITSGLISGEVSAKSLREIGSNVKNKTAKLVHKSADSVSGLAKKTKQSLASSKESLKDSYQEIKEQKREKSFQKKIAKEQSPFNSMFKSKANVEYQLSDLNDARKNLKSATSLLEKSLGYAENIFAIKSLLFEVSMYVGLYEKFSEQYLEGMTQLQKSKEYDDNNYKLAMDAFTNASNIIKYERHQRNIVNSVRNIVTEEKWEGVSTNDASNLSEKLEKSSKNFNQISKDVAKLEEIISSINEQVIDNESNFESLQKEMIRNLEDAEKKMNLSEIFSETKDVVSKYSKDSHLGIRKNNDRLGTIDDSEAVNRELDNEYFDASDY